MNLTKKNEHDESLLHRKRVVFDLDFLGPTPKKELIRQAVSKQLKIKPETVFIKKIRQKFGENKAEIITHIYSSEKDLKKVERTKEAKSKEEPKKEEKPKEEVKENDKKTKTKEQESKPEVEKVQDKQ